MQSTSINVLRLCRAGSIRMGLACIVLLIAGFITASAQQPLGEPNEVWVTSSAGDTIYMGQAFEIQVFTANQDTLNFFNLTMQIYSPDGASWDWIEQADSMWTFASPPNVLTPVPGFRWWGDNIEWRGASWGPSSDSGRFLTAGGNSFSLPDSPPGSLGHAFNIHLRATGLGTICVDSGFYSPAADQWIFASRSHAGIDPGFNGPFCFTVIEPPDVPGDINCDGSANVGDAVYLVNWIFKNGPAPCR